MAEPEQVPPLPYEPTHALGVVVAAAMRQGTHDATVRQQLAMLRRGLHLHDNPYATEVTEALREQYLMIHQGRARRAAVNQVIELLAGAADAQLDDALALLRHTNPDGYERLRHRLAGAEVPGG